MGEARSEAQAARALIDSCLAGELQAVQEFQRQYGELIYNHPMRVYHLPAEDAGEFYVFAFDQGRIFRRVQSYAGRTALRAFLLGCVLDNLVLEWKRDAHEIETVPMDTHQEIADDADRRADDTPEARLDDLLDSVEPEKAVVLKLLYIEDCELHGRDIRYLARVSGRRAAAVVDAVERLRGAVREREAGLQRTEDALDAVHAWIQLYERRLQRIRIDLSALPPSTAAATRLRDDGTELERKLRWRQQQRAELRAKARRRKITTPYKDIAALLNTSVGNVASQILRARRELALKLSTSPETEDGDE